VCVTVCLGVSCIMVCTNTNIDSMFAVRGGLVLQGGSMKKIIMCTLDLNNKNVDGEFLPKKVSASRSPFS